MPGVPTSTFTKFIFNPIKSGLIGFLIYFIVLVVIKSLGTLIGTVPAVTLEPEDVMLSAIGFIMFFLIKFLGNFGGEKP